MPSLAGIKTLAGEQSGDNIITQAAQADRKWGDWPGWLAMVVTRHLMYRVIIRCGAAWPPVLIISRDIESWCDHVTTMSPGHTDTLANIHTHLAQVTAPCFLCLEQSCVCDPIPFNFTSSL